MDASSSRLEVLLQAYLNNTASPVERQELMELIRMPDHEEALKALIGEEMNLLERTVEKRVTDDRAAQILANILPKTKTRTRTIGYPWIRWAAAAIIILLAGIGSLRLLSGKPEPQNPPAIASHDVAPGRSTAVLTLGNGAKITLDSAGLGKLAQQGNVNILKLDSGSVAYSQSKNAPEEIVYNSLTTPRGGQYQLTLPDGTRVWLDAESSIRYPTAFAGPERRVDISGQAYFEVTSNPKMPFVVQTGSTQTTVLGTHFNINAYPDEKTIKTTLLEGAVKFGSAGMEKLLHPGDQAIFTSSTASLSIHKTDTYQAVAWKNGQFDFDDMDLASIMRQIGRWYDVKVEFQTNDNGATFGGGISRQLNLSNVLQLLDKSGVHTRLDGKELIVLP